MPPRMTGVRRWVAQPIALSKNGAEALEHLVVSGARLRCDLYDNRCTDELIGRVFFLKVYG